MKLKVDKPAVRRFLEIGQHEEKGERRRYYVTRADDEALAVLVCRGGVSLHELANQIADAQVGYEAGVRGFVLEQHVGLRHTKITLYRRLRLRRYDMTLSQVLSESPTKD